MFLLSLYNRLIPHAMEEKSDRRIFLKQLGVGGITAGVIPASYLATDPRVTTPPKQKGNKSGAQRAYNAPYSGEHLNHIAFPLGGMGTGMFCVEGTGAISHMSVRNRPEIFHEPGMFAAISVKGTEHGAKVLEGPVPDWKKFGRPGAGNGSSGSTIGLPRFQNAMFTTQFPFCSIDLDDTDLPIQVKLTCWNPFIPTDADNSSLPVAALEYRITNKESSPVEGVFSYNSRNFLRIDNGRNAISGMPGGFVLSEAGTEAKPLRSDFAIFTDNDNAVVDHCWFRGGWWDPLTMAWNTIRGGETKSIDPAPSDAPGASLFVPFRLLPGAAQTIRVMMAWYTPETDLSYGKSGAPEECDPASG